MKIFLVTEVCFHVAYLMKMLSKTTSNFDPTKFGVIVRNNKKLTTESLTQVHNELKDKKNLSHDDKLKLSQAYGQDLSQAELALIQMHGVPEVHALTFPIAHSADNLNSLETMQWLEAQSGRDKISAIIFLDCILKPQWLSLFQNRIVNAHSAILPRARGMYAIEQLSAQGDQDQFERAAGASLHYIDEKVDMGLLIATQPVSNLWNLDTLWQVKACSYLTAFQLMTAYIQKPNSFSLEDGASYAEEIGPVFRAREFTPEIKEKAESAYKLMRSAKLTRETACELDENEHCSSNTFSF